MEIDNATIEGRTVARQQEGVVLTNGLKSIALSGGTCIRLVCKLIIFAVLDSRPLGPFHIALFRVENGIGTYDPRDGSYLFSRPQSGTSTDLDTNLAYINGGRMGACLPDSEKA